MCWTTVKRSHPSYFISRQSIQFDEEADYMLDTAVLQHTLAAVQKGVSRTAELEAALVAYQ